MLKPPLLCCLILLSGILSLSAQQEPGGVLLVQEPGSSYTEAIEYKSYKQENALFATLVTLRGERKKLKAASVVATLFYPPLTLDSAFAELAQMNLQKIGQLETRYPRVRPQLEIARAKWARALVAFHDNQAKPEATRTVTNSSSLPKGARLTSATADSATVTHASGVRTYPLDALSAGQVLVLNATSHTIQLPLGIHMSPSPDNARMSGKAIGLGSATQRVEMSGRRVIDFFAKTLGISNRAFSVWTFFVLLPALVLVLLIALIFSIRRGATTVLPPRRPLA